MSAGIFLFRARSRAKDGGGHHCPRQTMSLLRRSLRHGAQSIAPGLLFFLAASAPAQTGFQPIRSFGFPEGMGDSPSGGVIEGSDHKLYGTTVNGGANGDYGVVYSVQRDGSWYIALHHFQGAPSDGA